jgi:hypothetical protein
MGRRPAKFTVFGILCLALAYGIVSKIDNSGKALQCLPIASSEAP